MAKIGKRVGDDLYVHLSALDELDAEAQGHSIRDALDRLPAASHPVPSVAKLNLRTGRLSLLAYRNFEEEPFPELLASWTFASESASPPTYRSYADSLNPPILHRKELLVPPSFPGREGWSRLTSIGESLGLFDDPTTIGFKTNWERLLASKGYRLAGNEFVPIGNHVGHEDAPAAPARGTVQRHLTALSRSALSAPTQLLLRHGILSQKTTFFDYGCGRGGDVACLSENGFIAQGWDPHYAPDEQTVEADVVNLGFVVNVIEDPAERVEALHKAFRLARRVLAVSVMLYGSEAAGTPFRDGFITSRNTFQKYFSQSEFKDYVEQVLQQEAFLAGPGVAFVFADKDSEQRFSVARYRTTGVAERLLRTTPVMRVKAQPTEGGAKQPRAPTLPHWETELREARPLLNRLWDLTLDLGRYADPEEVPHLPEIHAQIGGYTKALRLLAKHYDQGVLAAAATTRSDDLRLYFATQQFSRRQPYGQLEPRLQRDIKAFFGDYRSAQAAGLRLLHNAADPSELLAACQRAADAGFGWLEAQHSLQLHISMVERLPVVLRAYIGCGMILWQALSEVQLVKIHVGSGKLTLMEFEDFDTSPVPLLRRRIKVNIRRQDYDIFEYDSEAHPKPLLYWKSRYLHEDYPGYAEQVAFDDALEATDIVGSSEFGPAPELLFARLESKRLAVRGMRLLRSDRIPDPDQACGKRFSFRSFLDCGETQQRLHLKNLPLNAATYNALYDLATQLLDPLVEYFGDIRLTYGFCSAELGRHISHRVAPKLDQHAACELGPKKRPICDRLGAACDFIVDDEDMREVADWIIANLPFDRLYFYGRDRPIHLSYGPQQSRVAYEMVLTTKGRVVPKPYPAP